MTKDKTNSEKDLSLRFRTDRSFYGGTQQQVFEESLRVALQKALEGVSSLVVLCGRKDSGKSFTAHGEKSSFEQRGLIPRALQQAFKDTAAMENDYDVRVR